MGNSVMNWELINWKCLKRRKPWASSARRCLVTDTTIASGVRGLIWSPQVSSETFFRRATTVPVSPVLSVETTLCWTREGGNVWKNNLRFWLVGASKMESWKGVFLLPVKTIMSVGKGGKGKKLLQNMVSLQQTLPPGIISLLINLSKFI